MMTNKYYEILSLPYIFTNLILAQMPLGLQEFFCKFLKNLQIRESLT
jgi:hypothetical protein